MLDSVANHSTTAWHNVPPPTLVETAGPRLSAACALLAVLVESQSTTQAGSKVDIELNAQKLEELKKQLADQIQAAKEAADSGGFFGFLGDLFGSDIAEIAGAVAAVAATIATGGAGAPLLLVVLAESMEVASKVGAELGLAPELCVALSLASVGLGLFTGKGEAQLAGKLGDVMRDVKLGAHVAQGASTATGGVFHGVAGYYTSEQLKHQADATRTDAQHESASLDIDDAIARLQRALRVQHAETNTASAMIDANSDTNNALSARI